jgi:steroid delta-isomerase-like uncharacterized protein
MKPLELAEAYFAAWNARDADAILATFGPAGTYTDPTTNGPLSGPAIAAYARGLWDAFPELEFEKRAVAEIGEGKVVAEWTMTGVNTGALAGLPPTGRTVTVPGVDVIETSPAGIASVTGYFDSRQVPAQLGLQILVQPHEIGPFSFGNSVAVRSGNKAKPGAFSITVIYNESASDDEIRALSRDTAREMLAMEGFIGVTLARVGGRGITISAWERPEHVEQIRKSAAHRKAMGRFWAELGDAAYTSVWTPERINTLWVRCGACHKMIDHAAGAGRCVCGAALPEAPSYF